MNVKPYIITVVPDKDDLKRAIAYFPYAKHLFNRAKLAGIVKKSSVIDDGIGKIFFYVNTLQNKIRIEIYPTEVTLYLVYSRLVTHIDQYDPFFVPNQHSKVLAYTLPVVDQSKLTPKDVKLKGTTKINGLNLVVIAGKGSNFRGTLAHDLTYEEYLDGPDRSGIVLYDRENYWKLRQRIWGTSYFVGSTYSYNPVTKKIGHTGNCRHNYILDNKGVLAYSGFKIDSQVLKFEDYYISWNPIARATKKWWISYNKYLKDEEGKLIPDGNGWYKYEPVDGPEIARDSVEGHWKDNGYKWKYNVISVALSPDKAVYRTVERIVNNSSFRSDEDIKISFEGYETSSTYYECLVNIMNGKKDIPFLKAKSVWRYSGETKISKNRSSYTHNEQLFVGQQQLESLTTNTNSLYIPTFIFQWKPPWVTKTLINAETFDCPTDGFWQGGFYWYRTVEQSGALTAKELPEQIQIQVNESNHFLITAQESGAVYDYNMAGEKDLYTMAFDNKNIDDMWIILYKYTSYKDGRSFNKNKKGPKINNRYTYGSGYENHTVKYFLCFKTELNGLYKEKIASYTVTRHGDYIDTAPQAPPDYIRYYTDISKTDVEGTKATKVSCQINGNYIVYTYVIEDSYIDEGSVEFKFNHRIVGVVSFVKKGYHKKFTLYDDDNRLLTFQHSHLAGIGIVS